MTMGCDEKSSVTEFTEKQVELLNDLSRSDPKLRQWETGIQDNGGPGGSGFPGNPTIRPPKGLGTILDEMNQATGTQDFLIFKEVLFDDPTSAQIVDLKAEDIVKIVAINVTEKYTDLASTLTIGTDSDPDAFAEIDLSDLSQICLHLIPVNSRLAADSSIKYFLSPGSSTAGRAEITLTIGQC